MRFFFLRKPRSEKEVGSRKSILGLGSFPAHRLLLVQDGQNKQRKYYFVGKFSISIPVEKLKSFHHHTSSGNTRTSPPRFDGQVGLVIWNRGRIR